MRGFMPSRLAHLLPVVAVLAAIGLSYGAYLSIPVDSETFGGLGISARGTITSIDPSMRVLNINHEPVKALNSPGSNCSGPVSHVGAGIGLRASVRRMASMARRPRRRAVSTTERMSA